MITQLPLIGRDRVLINKLAKDLHTATRRLHNFTQLTEIPRGTWFDVEILDLNGKPTGHIARVTIVLDRVEP